MRTHVRESFLTAVILAGAVLSAAAHAQQGNRKLDLTQGSGTGIVARPALGSKSHEGTRIDPLGNVYGISEANPASSSASSPTGETTSRADSSMR